jgi:hypothetical protein
MKRLFAMFVLTPREQRLVIFVVLALVLGFWVKHNREMSLDDAPKRSSEPSPTPLVLPSPNEQ